MSDALNDIARAIRESTAHDLATSFLSNVPGAPPIAQSIHILAICAVFSSSVFLALRVLGVAVPSQSPAEMAARLRPWFWSALPVLLTTGLLFVLARPTRYFGNPIFGLKMLMLVPAIGVALYLQRCAQRQSVLPMSTKLIAAASVLLWVALVLAGRWIAYVDYLIPLE